MPFIKVPGGNIWYTIVGNGKKTPLIMLHGGPGFPSNSLQTLDILAKNRKVIFYDQLGCGKSDRPTDKSLWNITRFVEELRILKNSLRIEKTFILGHSWGSMLAAEYAIKYPHEIKALILSGTFLSVPLWIRDTNRLKKGLSKNTQEVIHKNEKAGTLNSKEYQKATLEFYKKHLCRIYPYPKPFQEEQDNAGMDVYLTMWGPTEFNCTGNLKSYDLTSQLHKIKVPVLLLCGRYDEARPETVRYYKSLFPNAVMKVFEKSSHMSYLEERDNYIKTVEEFLKKVE